MTSYLAVADPLVNLAGQLVPASHLTNVHPARVSAVLQMAPQVTHLVLHVPLVAEEHLGPLQLCLCGPQCIVVVISSRMNFSLLCLSMLNI